MPETILIVDDEESVRRTFRDWLAEAKLDCAILTAADAEEALRHAQASLIDLAILDWNLGTGMDGLRLLEDLAVFRPDIVAILVTGYAAQATPLMALRMGVRDFLDKNHELTREVFLTSVRKQLAIIGPAKRQRELHAALAAFRSAVEQIVPLVQSSIALTEPAALPRAAAALCQLARTATAAAEAVLIVRYGDVIQAWSADGSPLPTTLVPFAKSLSAGAAGLGEPCIVNALDAQATAGLELQSFEQKRKNVLIAPLAPAAGVSATLELFDKAGTGFTVDDKRVTAAAAAVGSELLAQAVADRTTRQTLFAAVEAALKSTDHPISTTALPTEVRTTLQSHVDRPTAPETLELAEAIQGLNAKYGAPAVQHCLHLIRAVNLLLDQVAE